MHTLLEGARRPAAEAIARKQEGRGVSGPQRSRPRRNATAARINRSRDPGEFIRFVAASLKAARVSFASRSLLAVYGEGGARGGPRVCIYTLERTAIVVQTPWRKREREKPGGEDRTDVQEPTGICGRVYTFHRRKVPDWTVRACLFFFFFFFVAAFLPLLSTRCSLLRLFSFAHSLVVSAMVGQVRGRPRPSGPR